MDFINMQVGDELEFVGTEWRGANQAIFEQMQAHTVATIGEVLYRVDTERAPDGRVIRFTATRTK